MDSGIERDLKPGKHFPRDIPAPLYDDIVALSSQYGISVSGDIRIIDSSRGKDDLRLNYVIENKWVLRLCNAPEMNDKRLSELNRLIERYKEFGLLCPSFLSDPDGRFFHEWNGLACYLSEYIDLPVASELRLTEEEHASLLQEVQDSIAGFAQRYRNEDLSETVGMYSLFDLSPFDKPFGKDEKEQNFDSLSEALRELGEDALASRLEEKHARIRSRLKAVYRSLPRCMFQADENLSNVLVDEKHHLAGLIDFNLAGTEVIVNQFANLGGGFDEETEKPVGARARLEHALSSYEDYQGRMLGIYRATEAEIHAMKWYTWIALVAGWPQVCFFMKCLKSDVLRDEAVELLGLLAGDLLE